MFTPFKNESRDYVNRLRLWGSLKDRATTMLEYLNQDEFYKIKDIDNVEYSPLDLGETVENEIGIEFSVNITEYCGT